MIIYNGPSLLDVTPIIAIAIRKSGNAKTGAYGTDIYPMPRHRPKGRKQNRRRLFDLWRLSASRTPTNDPNRKLAENRSCYVNIAQGVLIVRNHSSAAYIEHCNRL